MVVISVISIKTCHKTTHANFSVSANEWMNEWVCEWMAEAIMDKQQARTKCKFPAMQEK